MGYDLLFQSFDLVERFGIPIAIAAWLTVFLGGIGLGYALSRRPMTGIWLPALAVGLVCETAHLSDILITLRISPDLGLEGNPIWLAVVKTWGLPFAKWYGYTGKLMVGVLNFEFFAIYLQYREQLFPASASSLREFAARFGESAPRRFGVAWLRIVHFFAWLFGLLGFYSFYVAFLNWIGGYHLELYDRFPSPPLMIAVYLAVLTALYFTVSYRAFQRRPRLAAA